MISKKELQNWLDGVDEDQFLAVDDGGLALVSLNPDGTETGCYIEIGGIPEAEADATAYQTEEVA